MSEKVKAKKTRPIAKKAPGKRTKEAVDPPASSPKLLKSKKKISKASSTKTSTKKRATKATAKVPVVVLHEQDDLMHNENPPLEEIFAKADKKPAKVFKESNAQVSANANLPAETPGSLVDDEVNSMQNLPSFGQEQEEDLNLKVKLSRSLLKKIQQQAEDEGLSIEDFVTELLAESVVLRAWEIVERKNQMRNPASASPNHRSGHSQNNNNNNQNRGPRGNKHRGGMSHGRYQSIMDDKATFLEYVRNQERSRR
ncbi:MAG: hypothetical protein ACOH5I_03785 [Oligoflexus sp.]